MFSPLLQIITLVVLIGPMTPPRETAASPNEPWISRYFGRVSSEREKAEMDNFAIQVLNDPKMIGYILIYSGADSCRGEAQARALRIKNYLMSVRGVPWNRVMWKDGGRYKCDDMEIFFLGFTQGNTPDLPYEPPANGYVIRDCHLKRGRRTDAANKSLDRSGGSVFRIKRGAAKVA